MGMGFFAAAEPAAARQRSSLVPLCGVCGLLKGCRSPRMPVSGEGRKGILIVGEAPGMNEDERGIQFCGKTGKLLERTLAKFDVDMRRDCWLTNSLACRPPRNKIDDARKIDYCRPLVVRAVNELRP